MKNHTLEYCPGCGHKTFLPNSDKSYRCSACGFLLYRNAVAAVAAIIECQHKILLTIRANDPDAGKLDLPGGFVDNGETAEAAMERELAEEIGFRPPSLTYFGSYPNTYPYAGVVYKTLDLIFTCPLEALPDLQPDDDVSDLVWVSTRAIPFERIAFDSLRKALADYSVHHRCNPAGTIAR
ncbi:MAG: NUDIX domain-containing protein [Desulfobacteraceae bacterium]|nr:NUDIX domain-containing protein [Desulfobacteraceae bacterium]